MLNVDKLRELMQEKGVKSIQQLSKCTKIPYTTLTYMINGHDMYVSTLIEISKFFQIPVDYLINKSYQVVTYNKDNTSKKCDTTSLLEAMIINKC